MAPTRSAVTGTVLALALTACSTSASPYADAGHGADPATGPELAGDGYTVHVPDGWSDATSQARRSRARIDVAGLAAAHDGFRTNLNVIVNHEVVDGTPGSARLSATERAAGRELTAAGFGRVRVEGRRSLDGAPVVHLSATRSAAGTSSRTEQYYAFHDNDAVIVTFSFPGDATQREANDVVSSTFASWRWS